MREIADLIEKLEALIAEFEDYNRRKAQSKPFGEASQTIAWTIEELTQIKEDFERMLHG